MPGRACARAVSRRPVGPDGACRSTRLGWPRVKQSLSVAEARRIALAAQGFAQPRPDAAGHPAAEPRDGAHGDAADRLGQRLRAVALHAAVLPPRAPTTPPRSTGCCSPARAPYVEYWAHMASFIPAADWGLFRFRMDETRAKYGSAGRLVSDAPRDRRLGARRARRPRPAAARRDRARRATGRARSVVGLGRRQARARVPVAVRRGRDRGSTRFRAALRAAEQVLPAERSPRPVARDDAIRELVARAARAHGVGDGIRSRRLLAHQGPARGDGRDRRPGGRRRAAARHGPGLDSRPVGPAKAWLHRDAALPRRVDAAAILTPFDPVVWFRDRAERLFDFEYRIEIYTPGAAARFGYYSLPVLIGDDIVGRVDLKADRAASHPARAVGVVGARPAGGCRGAAGRRAACRRALAGSRVDLGLAVG